MSRDRQQFLFVGNHVSLDFVNTQMIVKGEVTDLLTSFDDLLAWLVQVKLLPRSQAEALTVRLRRTDAQVLLGQAKELRSALRTLAERTAARQPIPDSAVETINRVLSQRHGYLQLVRTKGGFEREFQSGAALEERLLVPLAEAGSDLLCLTDWTFIKKCANDACILYFYDTTKNHKRTWCSMQLCGNRMKVAAFFERKRKRAR